MLFNSPLFIAVFLPVCLAGFFLLGARHRLAAAWWLAIASVVFYAGWSWRYVPLLLISVCFNFACGTRITALSRLGRRKRAKQVLVVAVVTDLALLGYYKYANFFIENINTLGGTSVGLLQLVLPLGISFFTFTQIAFLVDAYRNEASEPRFAHYLLFVTYFPHLIAGPILHHGEMMPQFSDPRIYRFSWRDFATGASIFSIGLFKKTVLADGIAPFVAPVFLAAESGEKLHFLLAWRGALAYTCQLYFDFSGYSDMAIGLSRMFGVRLPLNFNSPYKAPNITEFWRRWHMTLSRFLRDYLYIPLGGNRRGLVRRYANLIVTMFLGGLWHGASWTFATWGLLHGVYLSIHHSWRAICSRRGRVLIPPAAAKALGIGLTFLSVVVGWVFFRAQSFSGALRVLEGMAGLNGVILPDAVLARLPRAFGELADQLGVSTELGGGAVFVESWVRIALLLAIAFFLPNAQELARDFSPALDFVPDTSAKNPRIQFNARWAIALGALFAAGLLAMAQHSEFLYYQF
jgi:D-alanyl-lipoteichoic acid acyltransferase DltB (MBOAT superfamily)